jgi:hypothetical protein
LADAAKLRASLTADLPRLCFATSWLAVAGIGASLVQLRSCWDLVVDEEELESFFAVVVVYG